MVRSDLTASLDGLPTDSWRDLLEDAGDVLFRFQTQPERRLLWVTPSIVRLLGYTPSELVRMGDRVAALLVSAESFRFPSVAQAPQSGTATVLSASGRPVTLEIRTRPGRSFDARHSWIDGLVRATDDQQSELGRSAAYYKALVAHLPGAIAVHEQENILFVNPALAELTGYDVNDLLGKSMADLVPVEERPAMRERVGAVLQEKGTRAWEGRLLCKNGGFVWVDATTIPFSHDNASAAVTFLRDVTAYKMVQQQLMLADRMSSVGSLAAGVAHEINNPLAYVISNLAFVQDQIARMSGGASNNGPWSDIHAAVSDSREGLDRVRRIVRDLRTIAQSDEQRTAIDVRPVLESCLNLALIDIRDRARLVKDFAEVPLVKGNEARLSQVFLNLILNAMQAMPDDDAGEHELRVSLRPVPAGVEIVVQDTGVGIPPDVLPRIFDPFFTTKPGGIGTGLGLTICHRIVTSLGGTIRGESEPGRGTSFAVVLPSISPDMPISSGVAPRLRLLLVDSTGALDEASRQVLGARHTLAVASSSSDAAMRLRSGRIDLVLCLWPAHADFFDAAVTADHSLRSRFLLLVPRESTPRALPVGVRTLRFSGRIELDTLLPAIREMIETLS